MWKYPVWVLDRGEYKNFQKTKPQSTTTTLVTTTITPQTTNAKGPQSYHMCRSMKNHTEHLATRYISRQQNNEENACIIQG